jgi:hypothetical protein
MNQKPLALLLVACIAGAVNGAHICTISYSSDDCSGAVESVFVRHDGKVIAGGSDATIAMCDSDLGGYTVYQYDEQDFECDFKAVSATHHNSSKTACQPAVFVPYVLCRQLQTRKCILHDLKQLHGTERKRRSLFLG